MRSSYEFFFIYFVCYTVREMSIIVKGTQTTFFSLFPIFSE